MRFTLAEAHAEHQHYGPLLAWTLRVLNLLVIGAAAWALIETVSFLRAYVTAVAA